MKTLSLTLALLFVTFSFAQNRKALLKEIKEFQHAVCKNTSYQALTNSELINLSASFFSKSDYQVYKSSDSSITLIKKTTVSDKKTFPWC